MNIESVAPVCIEDRGYQEWLKSVRVQICSGQPVPSFPETRMGVALTPREQELYGILTLPENQGAILSNLLLARAMFNGYCDAREVISLGGIFDKFKAKLQNEASFLNIKGLGKAAGIRQFRLPFRQVPLMHQLYLNRGRPITIEEMAIGIFGEQWGQHTSLSNLRNDIFFLNAVYLQEAAVRVENYAQARNSFGRYATLEKA